MLIGPMLARFGVGYIPKPGGDKIGRRRLDTHFLGFQKLGAKFNFDIADEFFMVEGRELKGTYMLLDEASVTGTANIVMAAVMAKGRTTIYNAANLTSSSCAKCSTEWARRFRASPRTCSKSKASKRWAARSTGCCPT